MIKADTLTPLQRLSWARRTIDLGFLISAQAVLRGADFSQLQGDAAVEAGYTKARVALANPQRAEADAHAKAVLDMLAVDHLRRQEALLMCWQMADEPTRKQWLKASEKAWLAHSDTAALAYGDLLAAAGQREQALKVWQAAPPNKLIEERVLDLLDVLHDDTALLSYLAVRLQQQPERADLASRYACTLLPLGRIEAGERALEAMVVKQDTAQAMSTRLQTARWLRTRHLFGAAAQVLESALKADPQRWDVRKELAEIYGSRS